MIRLRWFAALGLFMGLVVSQAAAAEPELLSVTKIWSEGGHNAFTDLIHWHDKWWCTFREADKHVGGADNGKIRVIESADGDKWQSAALLEEQGIDLRDPKFSVTPDDRLMIVAGGSDYDGKELKGRRPRVTFSKDGHNWTPTEKVLLEHDWLWRATWFNSQCYGCTYDVFTRATPAAKEAAETGKAAAGPAEWKLRLVMSKDGVHWETVTHLDVPSHPNETTLRFLPDGEMIAMTRREGHNKHGWVGRSKPPYKSWTWKEAEHRFGGPNFIVLPNGSLWAGSRCYPDGGPAKTCLAKMTADGGFKPMLVLPSGGDCSYPGLVWHDNLLWMSYYSTHEGKTSIYLAKIKLSE